MTRARCLWLAFACATATPAFAQGGGAPAAPAAAAPAGVQKIAYINSRQILQQTPGYATAESTFNHEVEGYQAEIKRLEEQLDSAGKAFELQAIALSPSGKEAKQKELQAMQQHLTDRQAELQKKAQQREQELMAPIQARVNAIIQGVRAEGNYTIIFDADAPGNNIVAADPLIDLTEKVLARLKQSQ